MYITYHKDISQPEGLGLYPFACMNKELQAKLIEWDVKQTSYAIDYNAWYLFIYLKNGDRVDVSLN